MSSRALISGQAGVAVLLNGDRTQSFHLDGPVGIERRKEEIVRLFGDSTDVIVVEGIQFEAVSTRLELEWSKHRCLSLCLLLLDVRSHPEARQFAVPDIDEFLSNPEVAAFVRSRFFVARMPDSADLIGAINRAYDQEAGRLVNLLEETGTYQEEIHRCRSAWDELPARAFRDQSQKEAIAFELVQAGAFYQIATTTAERRAELLLNLIPQTQFQKHRLGLTAWVNSLSERNRSSNRAVEEQEEKTSRSRRPERQGGLRLEATLEVINRQKEAIKKALLAGEWNEARTFCTDLVTYQQRNSRPEHIAKSLCDLAQAAKDIGHHELQLEWTQRAVDIAPGDGWALAQLGDAHRCLGHWSDAEHAFKLAFQHGQWAIARNGLAEVLKGTGRLEEALREYESTIRDLSPDEYSRNGRAEVLKDMGRLEEALHEYESTAKDFPQSVVARNGIAEILKNMGRSEEALREYESIVKDFPRDVFARNGLAEVLKGMGRLEEAFHEYESIVKDFPQSVVARNGQAEVLKGMGRLDEALHGYESIVRDFPQDVFARNGLAEVLKNMGRSEEALREYELIAKEFPQNVVVRSGRAEVLKGMGRLDEALREYELIVKEFPHNVVARSGRAEILKDIGRLEDALREYELIVKEFPHSSVARSGMAEVLKTMGRTDEALRNYESTIKDFPRDVVPRNGRAEVLKAMGHLDDSLREYELIMKDFPRNVVARSGRAEVLKGMGRLDEALHEYDSIVRDFPHQVVARSGRAEALKNMGRLDEALREYELIVKDFPRDVVVRSGRAEALKGMGRLDDALREYESIVKDFPHQVIARNGLAEILKGMGRLDEALREYESIVKDFRYDVVARTGVASVCVLRGDYESAIMWIGSSVETEPVNWFGLHILGMIRLRTGKTVEAITLFERGLQKGPFESLSYFRSSLAYARLLAHQPKQAALALEDEPSLISRVLQIHIYGELNETEKARRAYDAVRSNRNPRVIELAVELVAHARLEKRPPAHSTQWVLDREFELLLAA